MASPISETPTGEVFESDLTEKDKQIMAMKDEDYNRMTWEELKDVIARNDLDALTRFPSDLRAYRTWSAATKAEYGSMTKYLLDVRLKWAPLPTDPPTLECENPVPFAARNDYKILPNDWPYGLAAGISHVVVWLKTPLPAIPETGELSREGCETVGKFVEETFGKYVQDEEKFDDRILWFKNWTRLQSIRGLEHLHVLLRDVPEEELVKMYDE
ncbi:hypothetical protein K402DRAFT_391601 [Aulographum hederae CBS 113979]|uniref:N-acetylglucosamine-induced protein 1 n=1 Tax=Aulographum hederae CBS 113979 TaxID=1176131 RepID=A0A6G1H6S2_9PEZI|nr:hypothetical protein K402DRAFT_391601 [Aulographum hederae CBS 113979]